MKTLWKRIEGVLLPLIAAVSILCIFLASYINKAYVHYPNVDKVIWGCSFVSLWFVIMRYKSMLLFEYTEFKKDDKEIKEKLNEKITNVNNAVVRNTESLHNLIYDVTYVKGRVDKIYEVKDLKIRYKRELEELLMQYLPAFKEPIKSYMLKAAKGFHAFVMETHSEGFQNEPDINLILENFHLACNDSQHEAEELLGIDFLKECEKVQTPEIQKLKNGITQIITDRFNSKKERFQEECLRYEKASFLNMIEIYSEHKDLIV